jgi:hypothetical protein
MRGCKTLFYAQIIIAGIETMHMIGKGRPSNIKDQNLCAADQVCSHAY